MEADIKALDLMIRQLEQTAKEKQEEAKKDQKQITQNMGNILLKSDLLEM